VIRRITHFARRNLTRRMNRLLDRACLRPARLPGPDDLSQALTAFSRAIHCHRRLARIAPEFFDVTTVHRDARFRVEQLRWRAIWQPALEKVYGPGSADDSASEFANDFPRLPGPRRQRVVERELAAWESWMLVGRAAMERHRQRRPHALLSLSRLARVIRVACAFKEVVFNRPADGPATDSPDFNDVLEQLERAYGHRREENLKN